MLLDTTLQTACSIEATPIVTASAPSQTLLKDALATVCTGVVTASSNDSVMVLSALLVEHQVGCLIITKELAPDDTVGSLLLGELKNLKPIGLVSERELVSALASGENLHRLCAQDIMRSLEPCVFSPENSLYLAYQILAQRESEYGIVTQEKELLGILSQSSLLRALNSLNVQAQLQQETLAHQQTQLAFKAAKIESTQQRDNRAAKLAEMNEQLKKDLRKRKRVEEALKQTLKTLQSAQTQIIQSERMAGLGHFVAGVAHEINNPVNFIHGNLKPARQYAEELLALVSYYQKTDPALAQTIQLEIEELEDIDVEFLAKDFPRLLDSMKSGTERIREIVKSLRNFSRLDEADVKPVDIHEGIENTLLLLPNRLKALPGQSAIRVVKAYGDLPMIECFASQLNQVFWHLLSNAIDAVRSHYVQNTFQHKSEPTQPNIGTIQIRTAVIRDGWIAIFIADNGPGIPEQARNQIFDPFYTTKPVGTGTGLGLSISHQVIAEKHGGKLYYHSTPGQGTEFVVELPYTISPAAGSAQLDRLEQAV